MIRSLLGYSNRCVYEDLKPSKLPDGFIRYYIRHERMSQLYLLWCILPESIVRIMQGKVRIHEFFIPVIS
jgi:hypothetical protein